VKFEPFNSSSRNLHADVELTTVRALYGKEMHMYVAWRVAWGGLSHKEEPMEEGPDW
jgi:hypothetical protein